MPHSTATVVPPGRAFASPAATPASQSRYESWWRPACSDACTSALVLVSDGDFRGWREIVTHDHVGYERRLESTVIALADLVVRAELLPFLDPTAAMLGMIVAGLRTIVVTGPLVVDLLADTLTVDGRTVRVSPQEWAMLSLIARRLDELVTYDELIGWLWPSTRLLVGRMACQQPSRSSIRSLVVRLRERLGPGGRLLVTEPSRGVILRYEQPRGGV